MTNKGIPEIPLFDPILPKMDCPLFGVTAVLLLVVEVSLKVKASRVKKAG